MRIWIACAGSLMLAACSPSSTAPVIDGTYKADVASAKLSDKPDTFAVKDGQYECGTCTPPYKIPADGKVHPVEGRDYWDAASVKVVDPSTLEMTRYRKGTAIGTGKVTVSADGQSLTWSNTSADNAAGKSVTNVTMSKRVGAAPAGAHAASGSWQMVKDGSQMSDDSITATIMMKGDTVTQRFPTGESYEAKLGGPQVPLVGDKAGAMVAVTAAGKGFKETDYVNGKPLMEYTYEPVDASTIKMTMKNLRNNVTEEYTLKKQ
ncbi:hypothetical protein OKA06_15765 [Novosphingobium sp. MW5]|nr:hypothetical protein [Novosphingobium sp. MW5]